MATNHEPTPDINALWARAQELLPGLRCPCLGGESDGPCDGCKSVECVGDTFIADSHDVGLCDVCPRQPDLALLLRAMREAGWDWEAQGYTPRPIIEEIAPGRTYWRFSRVAPPKCRDLMPCADIDPLTAALQAAVAALEAERRAKEDDHQ